MAKVLIVEDDLMLADVLEELLVDHGYAVCGIARTIAEADELGHLHKPDLAIIDYRLADGDVGTEAAAQLSDLDGLGILFSTGNTARVMHAATNGAACIAKPYSTRDLLRALEIVTEIVATGAGSPPFPRGFQMLSPEIIGRRGASNG